MTNLLPISICIIAKNEEKNIEKCLSSIAGYGFEIVVVDTGSTDATKEIALKYTDRVYEYEWQNDFAAAKNYAVEKSETPYVMILDSDEYIEDIDTIELENMVTKNSTCVGRIKRRNYYMQNGLQVENDEKINRIFSKELFHYEGKIHEQVVSKSGLEYTTYNVPVTIGHMGYNLTDEEKAQKAQRNMVLLLDEYNRLKEKNDKEYLPYIDFQLGKSYFFIKDYNKACDYFDEGLTFDLNPKLEYVIDMVETYGYALLEAGRAQDALCFEGIYDEFGNSADFKFLMGLIYMNNAKLDLAINEFLKATKYKECHMVGSNSFLAYYNIGVIYECSGNRELAIDYYRKCGDYAPALKQLDQLLDY